jgi:hypothetical protein
MQNLEAYGGKARLTLRPWQKCDTGQPLRISVSTIHTKPDAVSGWETWSLPR